MSNGGTYTLVKVEPSTRVRERTLLQGPCDVDGWSWDVCGRCSYLKEVHEK